jgi:hypothetical protein
MDLCHAQRGVRDDIGVLDLDSEKNAFGGHRSPSDPAAQVVIVLSSSAARSSSRPAPVLRFQVARMGRAGVETCLLGALQGSCPASHISPVDHRSNGN